MNKPKYLQRVPKLPIELLFSTWPHKCNWTNLKFIYPKKVTPLYLHTLYIWCLPLPTTVVDSYRHRQISTNINKYQPISKYINEYRPILTKIDKYRPMTKINNYQRYWHIDICVDRYWQKLTNINKHQQKSTDINETSTKINIYRQNSAYIDISTNIDLVHESPSPWVGGDLIYIQYSN